MEIPIMFLIISLMFSWGLTPEDIKELKNRLNNK